MAPVGSHTTPIPQNSIFRIFPAWNSSLYDGSYVSRSWVEPTAFFLFTGQLSGEIYRGLRICKAALLVATVVLFLSCFASPRDAQLNLTRTHTRCRGSRSKYIDLIKQGVTVLIQSQESPGVVKHEPCLIYPRGPHPIFVYLYVRLCDLVRRYSCRIQRHAYRSFFCFDKLRLRLMGVPCLMRVGVSCQEGEVQPTRKQWKGRFLFDFSADHVLFWMVSGSTRPVCQPYGYDGNMHAATSNTVCIRIWTMSVVCLNVWVYQVPPSFLPQA